MTLYYSSALVFAPGIPQHRCRVGYLYGSARMAEENQRGNCAGFQYDDWRIETYKPKRGERVHFIDDAGRPAFFDGLTAAALCSARFTQ